MSDKLRRTFTIPVSFSDGEQPPAGKLNAISSQSRNALGIVERAIGDVWNQSGDPILTATTGNALHIPNIARALGDLGLLNPRTFLPSTITTYSDPIGLRFTNQYIGYLKYPPTDNIERQNDIRGGGLFVLSGNGTSLLQARYMAFSNWVTEQPRIPGDWSLDADGKLYSVNPIPAALRLAYAPNVSGETSGGTFSVIPDPSTWGGAFAGLRIEQAPAGVGGYYLHLPPRQPLVGPPAGSRTTARTPDSSPFNISSTPEVAPFLAYQSATENASTQSHYRYSLPRELQGLAATNTYPSGFLYLWDETRGTIVEGVTYRVPPAGVSSAYVIHITGADLDNLFSTPGILSTTDVPASYGARFKLIIVGTSVASSLSALWQRFLDHRHGRADSNEVSHNHLLDLVTLPTAPYPPLRPLFLPSKWANDSHSQYLHRTGATADSATRRDHYDNAMLGTLFIAAATVDPVGGNNFNHLSTSSHYLRFGGTGDNSRGIRGMTEDSNRDRGLELDAGTSTTRERVILTQPRLQFGTGATRGLLLRDGQYFKFGASNNDGVATISNARLVANRLILNSDATDLRVEATRDPLTVPYFSIYRTTDVTFLATMRRPEAQHQLILDVQGPLAFGYQTSAGTSRVVTSAQLTELTDGGFAGASVALHRHGVWAASVEAETFGGDGYRSLGNVIGALIGNFSFQRPMPFGTTYVIDLRVTFFDPVAGVPTFTVTVDNPGGSGLTDANITSSRVNGSWLGRFNGVPTVIAYASGTYDVGMGTSANLAPSQDVTIVGVPWAQDVSLIRCTLATGPEPAAGGSTPIIRVRGGFTILGATSNTRSE